MRSRAVGRSTSTAEVTNISSHGLWLMVREREHFLPFDEFPWFREATVGSMTNVKLLHGKHLHWPEIDVDLSVDTLEHLESYPLVYR